jgi:hypothetical protein
LDRPWRLLVFSIPVALLLVPVSSLFNHRVLKATPAGIMRALEIFDLTGIAFYSGDLSVLGPGNSFTRRDVDNCYSPIGWDTLAPWGNCPFFWTRLAVSPDFHGVDKPDFAELLEAPPNPGLLNRWSTSIIERPFAYAQHRAAHFTVEMLGQTVGGALVDPYVAMQSSPMHLGLYDFLTMPGLWLAIGASLLILLASLRSQRPSGRIEAALALDISGLTYAGAYLIIGVASDPRYQYWSMVAIFVALVISLPELKAFGQNMRAGPQAALRRSMN